ncbi:MAG: peptidoglycan editing factor PgeF [Anaerolineae bacterium]
MQTETNGVRTYQFETLAGQPVSHAVFTRLGGVSQDPFATLNVGASVGDDGQAVAENHRRIYATLGLDRGQVVTARQVHGNRVALVDGRQAGSVVPNTDGLVTATPGLGLLLRFADCQPVLLYDPEHHALALAHAGWRGVAQGIVRRAVEAMQDAFGSRPAALLAGLGPAIGPCHYAVGHEVAAAMGYVLPDWQAAMELEGEDHWRLDLSAANAQLLAAAGVTHIEQAGMCTACHNDEFFSHRAEGGRTGRFAVVACLQLRPGAEAEEERLATPDAAGDDELALFDSLQPPGMPGFGPIGEGDS